MIKQQPDFTSIFFQSLGGQPAAITYRLRRGLNVLHDLSFMNALLHDATLLTPHATPQRGRLQLDLRRDCWELGFGLPHSELPLHTVNTTVILDGVRSISWQHPEARQNELMLDYCWIDRAYRDHDAESFEFSFIGLDWSCDILLDNDNWEVEMRDAGHPMPA